MKLRNKKTGEIGNLVFNINPNRESYSVLSTENGDTICGNLVIADHTSLAELNEEWEDYEEPKNFWYIEPNGVIARIDEWDCCTTSDIEIMKSLGNYFETKEEAEQAVEKLKAWKRLKDIGFRFCGHDDRDRGQLGDIVIYGELPTFEFYDVLTRDDLDLLFGGEE